MTGQLTFQWDSQRPVARVRRASYEALDKIKDDARAWWLVVVPVRSGRLRDSWFAEVSVSAEAVWLFFGAGNPPVPYVLFVELGTGVMPPRAPIRTTAGEVTPLVLYRLRDQLSRMAA